MKNGLLCKQQGEINMKIRLSKTQWEAMGKQAGWAKTIKTAQNEQPVNKATNQEVIAFLRAIVAICDGVGHVYQAVRNSSSNVKYQEWDTFDQDFKSQYENRYIQNVFTNLEKFNGKVMSNDGWEFNYNQTGCGHFLYTWNEFFKSPQNNIELLRNSMKNLDKQLIQIYNAILTANPQVSAVPISHSFIEE